MIRLTKTKRLYKTDVGAAIDSKPTGLSTRIHLITIDDGRSDWSIYKTPRDIAGLRGFAFVRGENAASVGPAFVVRVTRIACRDDSGRGLPD